MAALLGQVGGLGNVADFLPGQGNGADLYVRLLETEVVKDEIIGQFDIHEVEKESPREDLYKVLDRKASFEAGRRDGVISIAVDDRDPEQAAAMANAYARALEDLVARLNSGSAGKDRIFLEKRLAEEKVALAEAEEALRVFQAQSKTLDVGEQGKATIEAVARLRAELVTQEVRLAMLRQSMTESNPEVQTVRRAIDQLRRQIAFLEGEGEGEASAIPALGAVPTLVQQYARLLRDLKVREAVVELLTRQYEVSRLTEAKDVAGLKVVQLARVPEKKFKPRRSRIVLLTTYVVFVAAVLGAFIRERLDNLPAESRERWRRLRTQLFRR
jgi:uncharacterized protein involved in exopolysaccharide biosynthesis